MKPYDIYLEKIGAISEDDFYEVINSLPAVEEFESVHFEDNDYDKEGVTFSMIEEFICENTQYGYLESCDCDNKTVEIEDIETIEDLEKISSVLSEHGWTISNYDAIVSYIKENKDDLEFSTLMSEFNNKITLSKLREIVKSL